MDGHFSEDGNILRTLMDAHFSKDGHGLSWTSDGRWVDVGWALGEHWVGVG